MRDAAEYVIGNLNEDGYLPATDEELLQGFLHEHSGQTGGAGQWRASAALSR